MDDSRRRYFAARDRKDIGRALMERLKPLLSDERQTNIDEMRNAYCHLYGVDVGYGTPTGVTRGGERGELAQLRISAAATDLRAKHALVTAQEVMWKPQAKNGLSSVAEATSKSSDVLEDQWKGNRFGIVGSEFAMGALGFGESFVFHEWDKSAGPALAALDDKLYREGAVTYHLVPSWDAWRDSAAKSFAACQWLYVRVWKNRFDLVKEFTELADGREGDAAMEAILSACDTPADMGVADGDRYRVTDSELIPVWHFFHLSSVALPMGRHVTLLSEDVVLHDEPLKGPNSTYNGMPVHRLADVEVVDSPFARAVFWDTLGAQEVCDAIDTAMATRATMMSAPIFAYEKGSDLSPEILASGGRAWGYPRGAKPPVEVAPAKVPGESLEYRRDVRSAVRETMGLNDAAVGQQKGAEMNAQASALLASMAVQQAGPFQKKWLAALGAIGQGVLRLLAQKVTQPRTLQMTRSASRHEAVTYTGEELKGIEGVQVDVGNALEQTAQGRLAIADLYVERGWATGPEQYSQVISTGRLEPISRRNTNEMTLIQYEYEQLLKGKSPPVHYAQNHALHFRENSAAILDPGAVENPDALQAVETHLDEHYLQQFGMPRAADPLRPARERWMLGQPIGPGQEMPLGPPGAPPGGPPGAAPGGPPAPNASDAQPPPGVAPPAAADIPLPEMPPNPLTGEQFNSADGGGVVAPN
jgi:hypothetical protein